MAALPKILTERPTLEEGIRLRVNIQELSTQQKWQDHYDLLIQAFIAFEGKDTDDVWGCCQIAGIHGLPYQPYDNATGDWKWTPGTWGGYCQHGSPLFPTWHRPYMLYIEQAIRNEAMNIAKTYREKDKDGNPLLARYIQAATELAMPYWDWASQRTADTGAPTIFTLPSLKVRVPPLAVEQELFNPLYSYCLPKSLGKGYPGARYNPTGAPNYLPPLANKLPYTPEGYSTVRSPDGNCQTQVDKVNLSIQQYATTVLQPGVHAMFGQSDWTLFSNHSTETNPDGTVTEGESYGVFASLEVVHDAVHDAVGGAGGHMSYPDIAAFDPIFWIHHCNVDRLLAIWQVLYPDSWVPDNGLDEQGTFTLRPGSKVNSKTELTPFRKGGPGSGSAFMNSDDVRYVEKLSLPGPDGKPDGKGYTYPDLLKYKDDPIGLWKSMIDKYAPNARSTRHWYANYQGISKQQFGGPFQMRVFLYFPGTPTIETPLDNPHYVGTIFIFARGSDTRCAKCKENPDMKVDMSLELTATMTHLGLSTDPESVDDQVIVTPGNLTYVAVSASGEALGSVQYDKVDITTAQWDDVSPAALVPPKPGAIRKLGCIIPKFRVSRILEQKTA